MEKREPRLEKEILNRLGTHQAILFFRNRPTLVQLVYYFPPGAVLAREVPLLPKTPRQPVALTEYVREKQIEAAKARAEKKEEPQPPAAPVRKPGRAKRVPAPKRKDADQAQT